MIYLVWSIWLFVIVFNVIMLLNFLIAFISETYEEVYGRGKIDDFKNMAQLNYESRIITQNLVDSFTSKYVFKPIRLLVVIVRWLIMIVYSIFYFVIWFATLRFKFDGGYCYNPKGFIMQILIKPAEWLEDTHKFVWKYDPDTSDEFDYIVVTHAKDYQI